MKSRTVSCLLLFALGSSGAHAGRPESQVGFKTTKIFAEAGDCLFSPRGPEELRACPVKAGDPMDLTDVQVVASGAIPDELLVPIVDAGLKTISELLKAAGSDSSYSTVQGISIDIANSPRCLLLVHGEFLTRGIGTSLASHLATANPDLHREREDRCEQSGKIYESECAMKNGASKCPEVDPKGTGLYNTELANEIWLANEPALVLELRIDMSQKGLIRFSPSFIDYSATLKSQGNGSRDLIVLAHGGSKESNSPFTESNGRASAEGAQVLFDFRGAKTGARYRAGASEPWSPLLPFTPSATTESEEGNFSLWFGIVETKRGSAFLKNLGTALDDSDSQKAIKDAAMNLIGTKSEDSVASDAETASSKMKILAAKKKALFYSAKPYCIAEDRTNSLLFDVEVEYYDYQDAYTVASRAMRTAGRRLNQYAFPKPEDTMSDSWVEDEICSGDI